MDIGSTTYKYQMACHFDICEDKKDYAIYIKQHNGVISRTFVEPIQEYKYAHNVWLKHNYDKIKLLIPFEGKVENIKNDAIFPTPKLNFHFDALYENNFEGKCACHFGSNEIICYLNLYLVVKSDKSPTGYFIEAKIKEILLNENSSYISTYKMFNFEKDNTDPQIYENKILFSDKKNHIVPKILNKHSESNITMNNSLTINVKYLDPDMPKIEAIDKGDWIDLCTTEYVQMRPGEFKLIPLGVIIQLPEGYEALLLPRSSTFKKYGILVANSMGVIDNSYRGPKDQWMLAAYGTKDIEIPKYARIAQFRIIKNQPKITINEISEINEDSRGGFGSTGN